MVSQSDSYFIVPIIKSCAELTALYPRENTIVQQKLQTLLQRISDIIVHEDNFSIIFENQTLSINGTTITHNQIKRPQAQWLLGLAKKNQISEIIFNRSVNENEIYCFGQLLQEMNLKHIEFSVLQDKLEKNCRGHIYLVHISGSGRPASTDSGNAPLSVAGQPMVPKIGTPKNKPDFKGQLPPSQEVSPRRLFEISESEKMTLVNFIGTQIEKGQQVQLYKNLVEMTKDMNTFDMESSFLGANSLKISVETLIELNQVDLLRKFGEELFVALPGIPRDDIYEIAIELLQKVLLVFRTQQLLVPFLNGIRWFAQVGKLQNNDRKQKIKQTITSLLDIKLTSFLLSLTQQKHALKEQILQLFNHFSTELAEPLFMLLFYSEKRTERKLILAFLTHAGEEIMPITLQNLKEAIKQHSPWYVKRNLLFLFCRFPSNELAPLIDSLKVDSHPKLREQLLLACLYLKSPKAVEYGTQNVAECPVEGLDQVLRIIAQVKNKAYDQVLVQRFHNAPDAGTQIKIMGVLKVLDTNYSRSFFEDVLTAKKMMSLKYSSPLRVEAAKNLYESESRHLFKLMFSLKEDRDAEVKYWAQKFIAEKGASSFQSS